MSLWQHYCSMSMTCTWCMDTEHSTSLVIKYTYLSNQLWNLISSACSILCVCVCVCACALVHAYMHVCVCVSVHHVYVLFASVHELVYFDNVLIFCSCNGLRAPVWRNSTAKNTLLLLLSSSSHKRTPSQGSPLFSCFNHVYVFSRCPWKRGSTSITIMFL